MGFIKTPEEIEIMSEAGHKLARVLKVLTTEVRAGVRTMHLEDMSFAMIKEQGADPAFLNYRPAGSAKAYPFTICVSVNDTIVHGQPSKYVIKDGDIVKLDLGLKYKGFYVDSAVTVGVGDISREAKKLVDVTRDALYRGIREALAGNTTGDIGHAIERYAIKNKFSVVRSLVGHGIGKNLHEEPAVPNFGRKGDGDDLVPGMVIAIEPMVAAGSGVTVQGKDDSFMTRDGSLSAHFEHTVAITKKGPRILTE
jgi:methionyl aminopeptidase